MPKATYRAADGAESVIEVDEGVSLMHAAISAGLDGIIGECGGNMMCATCHVYVSDDVKPLPPMSESEDALLDCAASPRRAESRLGCQIAMSDALDGIVVELPEDQF